MKATLESESKNITQLEALETLSDPKCHRITLTIPITMAADEWMFLMRAAKADKITSGELLSNTIRDGDCMGRIINGEQMSLPAEEEEVA